jgi:subtilisin family serine protease
MSLGGLPSFSLWRAINRAVASNVIVLAAAGNCVGIVVFPARYEGCLAIGATNNQNTAWQGSCSGPDVDVSAPGENVYAARSERKPADAPVSFSEAQSQGTSFAVALTAGAAALWLAHHGRDTLITHAGQRGETLQAMFRRLVRASSMRPGADWDATEMGAGIVDAENLLRADLDLGRDRESLGIAFIGTTSDAVKRLVLETTGSAAAAQEQIDWERYGPEIAYSLMMRQRLTGQDAVAHRGTEEAAALSPRPVLSSKLNQLLDSSAPLAQALRRS